VSEAIKVSKQKELIERLRTRAAIRRKIDRGDGKPDRIAEACEDAAKMIEELVGVITRCRPAVRSWESASSRQLMKAERGEYPPHYKPLLKAEAERAGALLDEVDEISS
jgi:hypothetical protein